MASNPFDRPGASKSDLDYTDAEGTTIEFHPSELSTFHRNARHGDVAAIAASLRSNGQFKPIVVNVGTHTGRRLEVLAGNHTLKAFRDLAEQFPDDERWQCVKAHLVDVDEDRATRIVLADNRTFERGEADVGTLLELLNDLPTIEGTGYDQAALDELTAALDSQNKPPSNPTGPNLGNESVFSYTIQFDDELQQTRWFDFIKWVKTQHADPDLTVAERLLAHLDATAGERV